MVDGLSYELAYDGDGNPVETYTPTPVPTTGAPDVNAIAARVTLAEQSADPAAEAGFGQVYALPVAGVLELFYRSAGGIVQLTSGGVVNAAGGATDLSYTAATRVLASSTGADATLPLLSSGDAGLAPASGGGTAKLLRADGTWVAPRRPDDFRHTGATYTNVYPAGQCGGAATNFNALSGNVIYAVPFFAPLRGGSVNKMLCEITTGVNPSNSRMGIYTNTSDSNVYPDQLVANSDTGSISSAAAAVLSYTYGTPIALTPGELYWAVFVSSGSVTVRALNLASGQCLLGYNPALGANGAYQYLRATLSYGSLPSTFPGSPTLVANTVVPLIALSYSA